MTVFVGSLQPSQNLCVNPFYPFLNGRATSSLSRVRHPVVYKVFKSFYPPYGRVRTFEHPVHVSQETVAEAKSSGGDYYDCFSIWKRERARATTLSSTTSNNVRTCYRVSVF
jgi:hypothetical protein